MITINSLTLATFIVLSVVFLILFAYLAIKIYIDSIRMERQFHKEMIATTQALLRRTDDN